MQGQQLRRFLEAQTTFSFGEFATTYTASEFWCWAFSNMNVPVLRGVLIEYLVARNLIAECDSIVGDTVRELTTYTPGPGDLARSIEHHYQIQPHGDVFDLQLTWGVTLEIKSTASPLNWRLNKTCRWNILKDKNHTESVFPAQFYILAVMDSSLSFNESTLNLGSVAFHIRTGRELEALTGKQQSLGFAKFVGNKDDSRSCCYDQLASTLRGLQKKQLERIREKLRPGWKLSPVPGLNNLLPLAVENSGGVQAGWYVVHKPGRARLVTRIEDPWCLGAAPDWRDWEAAGFAFVPEVIEQ